MWIYSFKKLKYRTLFSNSRGPHHRIRWNKSIISFLHPVEVGSSLVLQNGGKLHEKSESHITVGVGDPNLPEIALPNTWTAPNLKYNLPSYKLPKLETWWNSGSVFATNSRPKVWSQTEDLNTPTAIKEKFLKIMLGQR